MLDNVSIEELLKVSQNRYELIDVLSRRAHQLLLADHNLKVSDALNAASEELAQGSLVIKSSSADHPL